MAFFWSYAVEETLHQSDKTILEHFESLDWEEEQVKARIYKSRIRPTQDGGGVVYESLIGNKIQVHEWSAHVMGQIARAWFCGWAAPLGHELSRDLIGPELIQRLRQLGGIRRGFFIGFAMKLLKQRSSSCSPARSFDQANLHDAR